MRNLLRQFDLLLRGFNRSTSTEHSRRDLVDRALIIVLFVMFYGGVMGSWGLFSGTGEADHWLFSVYSAVKVPFLLLATFMLSLPALFVFYTLAGLRADFPGVVRSLMDMQGVLSIVLGGLSPFTLLWYASSSVYQPAVLFNGVMFGVATISSMLLMRRHLQRITSGNPRHRTLLRLWGVVYIFVGIQMGWGMRPFVGSPGSEARFFRGEDLDNAYVVVTGMILELFSR